ncbi:MAG TPA: copper-containing nitrite reductase [Paracoccaceae bacterium]|nr:copper-containing nitrite reductase [Paracoccaceae bacterium]
MTTLFRTTVSALAMAAIVSTGAPAFATAAGTGIAADATAVPAAVERRAPAFVRIELETIEKMAELNDGSVYRYWTFNGQVPGPMVRVREGDTVEVVLKNADDSWMMHNIDLHAVTGPHGGGEATMAEPGQTRSFTFKALKPGLYVYHCATPMVAQHIANGMYGMILVEPEEGLAPVDREFYVMQGELYTAEPIGTKGELTEDFDALLDERPSHFVFNGRVGSLTGANALEAKVGETVRIYFGVGGPNKASSFHMIGEIFDRIWALGNTEGPTADVQTVTVAPGGATIAEVTFEVPGTYALVDHALSRVEKGLVGHIEVEGPPNREVFDVPVPAM